MAYLGWSGGAKEFKVCGGVWREFEVGDSLALGSEVFGDGDAGFAFVLGSGEGEDFRSAGEEFAGTVGFVFVSVQVGGFSEQGSAGEESSHATAVFVVEEGDEFGGGGVEEGFVVEAGELGGVLLEEAEEVVGLLGLPDAEGAEGEFDDAFDFAEEVVLAEHCLELSVIGYQGLGEELPGWGRGGI